METVTNRTLSECIRRARIVYALTRWETATIVALTILATPAALLLARTAPLPPHAWILVLGIGAIATAAVVAASLTDPPARERCVLAAIERRIPVDAFADESVRRSVERAIQYRLRAEKTMRGATGAPRTAVRRTTEQTDGWLVRIHQLGTRLDALREESRFQLEEQRSLRTRITTLERQLNESVDPRLEHQIRQTLAAQRHQLRTIEELQGLVERGLLQLEHAVGALGTVHTQLALIVARDPNGSDPSALAVEIEQGMRDVDSVLSALDRIYERTPQN